MVGHALKLLREGHLIDLAGSPLAESALVAAEFLDGEPVTPATRGRAVQQILAWAIEELCPADAGTTTAATSATALFTPTWRLYKLLHYHYLKRWTIEQTAEALHLAPTSIFNLRPKAVAALADFLQGVLANGDLIGRRQQQTVLRRYHQLTPQAQQLLQAAVILRHPFPLCSFVELAEVAGDVVTELQHHGFLAVTESMELAVVPSLVREVVRLQSNAVDQQQWHANAATHYQAQLHYVEAAYHWYHAKEPITAAEILLTHTQAIINGKAVNELIDLLDSMQPANLPPQQWARLRLLAGQVAELLSQFEAAIEAYTAALRSTEPAVEAEAHYRLARILEYRNLDEALVHYTRGIDLLERYRQQAVQGRGPIDSLLVKMYIHCSWIFIQGRQDLQRADSNLQRARLLIDPQNRTDWADLYNAGGELAYREENFSAAVAARMEAWLAAKERNDVDRMVKIAYNLGRDYTALRQFAQALFYLETSRQLAQSIGMRNLEAGCRQIAGDCYFYQERYAEAIVAFQDAHRLYHQLKNYAWLAGVCYDLAATYALTQQWGEAQHYYREGVTLAHNLSQTTGNEDSLLLRQKLKELQQQYPQLANSPVDLNPRQQRALVYVAQYGEISNRVYRTINQVENKTAAEDLKGLVAQGLLEKVGKGAATRYQAPAGEATVAHGLTGRQQEALTYIRQHGQISNRIYRDLTQVGNKAAAADLRDLVEMGLVKQQGKGPATIYRLV